MALPKIQVEIGADVVEALGGIERVEDRLRQMGNEATRSGKKVVGASSGMTRGIQNAAFQMGDFAVQVGAGTSASIALGQQLPQLLGGFGVLGAVLGAVVAIAVPLSRAFQGMTTDGQNLSQVLGTMQPLAGALARSFETVRDAGIQMAEVIINNLDRIISVGIAAAAIFGGRFVAGFIAARVATFSLSAALVALRGALIRTGIGAIIVGAGELVYQFSSLVKASGGFGEAIGLLKSLAVDVFERIKDSFRLVPLAIKAGAADMAAYFVERLRDMVKKFEEFINSVIDGINEAFNTNISKFWASDVIQALTSAKYGFESTAFVARESMDAIKESITAPIESIAQMRELLRSLKEEGLDLPSLLSGATDEDGDGAGKKTQEEIDRITQSLELLRNQGRKTWQALGNFMQQFAGKSKAAAVAAIAINKGLAIATAMQNTAVAVTAALKLDPTGVLAARTALLGKIQVGLIAATGLAQAASAVGSSGGGGGSAGATTAAASTSTAPAAASPSAYINISGGDMITKENLASMLNQLIEDGATIAGVSYT